jgi:hypothetical protein
LDGTALGDWRIFAVLTGPGVIAAAMFPGMRLRDRRLTLDQARTG